jgi:A/G-specific adenine glycosylase
MLQQTTVPAVIPYYGRWLRLFPDVEALARAPLTKVLKAWEGLGYYERARRLHRAARIVWRQWGGSLPRTEADLRGLPGFGPYTAAAVLSLAFGLPLPALDANARRVVSRLKNTGDGVVSDRAVRAYLDELLDRERPADFNQAVMELGALVCRPRRPLCPRCPVRRFCLAFRSRKQEKRPQPKRRPAKKIETVVAVIERNGRFLIQKRPASGLLACLWEFPGGKRERGESLESALRREIREELGVSVKTARLLIRVRHAYTRFRVTLYAYETVLQGVPRLGRRTHRWVSRRGLESYAFPSGNARIIDFLKSGEDDYQPRRQL